MADQLVKAVQVPACALDVLQSLGDLTDRRHGLVANPGQAAIGVGCAV